MSLTERFLVWISSFIVFVLVMFISYKISYKLGIKKALYRTTYILLSVIFAFVLTPLINNYIFDLDLSKFGITLRYKDRTFNTFIDYIEEVIVHSRVLNDLYIYFPSLKDLLMDFPQVLFAPIMYVLLFVVFLIVWFPLYMYLSYKRKRRVLYERKDNKKHRRWAGVLGCVQMVFIISVLLSSVNGINRIYQNSIKDTLDEKYSSLCDGHEVLEKYKDYCDVFEFYDSSVFAMIGTNGTISNYIFDSLTRIHYEDDYTSLSKEASLIIKSGIVLNQSGLLDSVMVDSEELLIEKIAANKLTDKDIDIIVETLSESKYSENLVNELADLVEEALNEIMRKVLAKEEFSFEYKISKEELINEIKVVLKTLMYMGNKTLLRDSIKLINRVIDFINLYENKKNVYTVFDFFIDIGDTVNLNQVREIFDYFLESKIFTEMLPYIIDENLGFMGLSFIPTQGDLKILGETFIDFLGIVQKYHVNDPLKMLANMKEKDMATLANILRTLSTRPEYSSFVRFIFDQAFMNFDINYFPNDFLNVYDWSREVEAVCSFSKLADKFISNKELTVGEIGSFFAYRDTLVFEAVLKTARSNPGFVFGQFILAAGR